MAKKTDQATLKLINEVKRRKEEIARCERANWLTNCAFTYIEGNMSGAVNLHVQTNVLELINIAAFLREKERAYNEAAKELGVEDPPAFKWCGFPVAEWLEDVKTRINKVQIASKKKKLEALEARLGSIISPELRAEMELQAIASELG